MVPLSPESLALCIPVAEEASMWPNAFMPYLPVLATGAAGEDGGQWEEGVMLFCTPAQ